MVIIRKPWWNSCQGLRVGERALLTMVWLKGERDLFWAARGHCLVRSAATSLCSRNIDIGEAGENVQCYWLRRARCTTRLLKPLGALHATWEQQTQSSHFLVQGYFSLRQSLEFQECFQHLLFPMGFPPTSGSEVQECLASLIPGSGRSPGERNGNALQYSCLGNPMDRVVWQTTVHGSIKSWTRLSEWTTTLLSDSQYLVKMCPPPPPYMSTTFYIWVGEHLRNYL